MKVRIVYKRGTVQVLNDVKEIHYRYDAITAQISDIAFEALDRGFTARIADIEEFEMRNDNEEFNMREVINA